MSKPTEFCQQLFLNNLRIPHSLMFFKHVFTNLIAPTKFQVTEFTFISLHFHMYVEDVVPYFLHLFVTNRTFAPSAPSRYVDLHCGER